MFTHNEIWSALDRLAQAYSTSPSGLAKLAGLDPTTFNKSKRRSGTGKNAPLIGLAQAGNDGFFDDSGFPKGAGWEEIDLPAGRSEGMYVLEISGESMAPVFRHGEKVIVAPHANVRRGDRVVVKTLEGEILAKELNRMTETYIELLSVNSDYEDRLLARKDVAWIARIMWVSQ